MTHVPAALRKAAFLAALGAAISPVGVAQGRTGHGAAQAPQADAQQDAAIEGTLPARLSDVEGSVRVLQTRASAGTRDAGAPDTAKAETAFRQATVNMPVLAGMEIETGRDGRAELQFNNGSIVRLTPNSALTVLTIDNSDEQLRAVRGLSYLETPNREAGSTTVQVGPQQARPSAGSLIRLNLDSSPYQVAVLRGVAHFESPGAGVEFSADAGQSATFDPTSESDYDVQGEVAQESWDEWNADRDGLMAQLASGETNARNGTGDEDSPAWNDLDYYGTWYDVPGAGMAWAPDGVDASFDPYGSGAWGYYTGVGYTWVSAYPWGWLPYRSGSWHYFDGFGWLWQPSAGTRSAGWYPYTHVGHRPPGYSFPLPPSVPRPHTRLTGAPLPKPQPLLPVSRGAGFGFRQIGGARPEPRVFALNHAAGGAAVPTLPVRSSAAEPRQPYVGNSVAGGNQIPGQQPASSLPLNNQSTVLRGGAVITPGPHVIGPAPSIVQPPRTPIVPPPSHLVPPPAPLAVPPPAAVAAPHAH